jgi:hypothetical protein
MELRSVVLDLLHAADRQDESKRGIVLPLQVNGEKLTVLTAEYR